MKDTVLLKAKNVYGNELLYPANLNAKWFADLTGKKTLDQHDISLIEKFGFNVIVN